MTQRLQSSSVYQSRQQASSGLVPTSKSNLASCLFPHTLTSLLLPRPFLWHFWRNVYYKTIVHFPHLPLCIWSLRSFRSLIWGKSEEKPSLLPLFIQSRHLFTCFTCFYSTLTMHLFLCSLSPSQPLHKHTHSTHPKQRSQPVLRLVMLTFCSLHGALHSCWLTWPPHT